MKTALKDGQFLSGLIQSFYLHFSGQPVALKQKQDSDVGVISNVAMYSLKAKVGKLESENQKLSEKVHQLEREKATLSLLNTESRYSGFFVFVCLFFSCDCNYFSLGSEERGECCYCVVYA